MKKYTAVLLTVLTVFVAVTSGTVSAADNVSDGSTVFNVIGTDYECDNWSNEQYPVIDISGDKYVPLFIADGKIWDSNVNKLARLVLDSDETYTLKPGEKIDLDEGYALEVKQISIGSLEVWLELTREGQYIADQIIPVKTDDKNTWNVTLNNIQGENDVIVMKVYVNNIFVGAEDCVVRIDGIWLVDYQNARTLNIGDKLGEFNLKKVINGTDTSNLGSLVFENTTEFSAICSVTGTDYECDSWSSEQYPLIDLFGNNYVPLFSSEDEIWQSHTNKLAGLVLDTNETYTIEPGEKIDLGEGYALEVKQISIDSDKVWLEFTKDGQYVADKNVSIDAADNRTWEFTLDNVQDENNIVVMKVHVKNLFVGTETSVIWIDGVWLIDYASSRTLNIGDKIGEFTLEEITSGVNSSSAGSLVFENASVADEAHSSNLPASLLPENEPGKPNEKSTGSPYSWCCNFWKYITIKCK